MTPAIKALEKAKTKFQIHEYQHDANAESYGLEAAEKLGIDPSRVFKTLVVMLDAKDYVVGIIPVSAMLSMKQIAKAAGAKKAVMADKQQVERMSGYVLGGVSPFGQKKLLKTFVDTSAQNHTSIFVSAGRRGLEVEVAPDIFTQVLRSQFFELTQE
ncbi:Cys-tRNA(Pro) deacylase [Cellvibrio sp. NN19]|uniref:Cys-tRNA(Pro) deacylase n=1 Tax=Cellvibrio chitinivorans TaxID=3102792 RepID=UPI002B4125ED|nr:Cys-tRNA(Pro) deacylase [Cellvibrio sp. NN19]